MKHALTIILLATLQLSGIAQNGIHGCYGFDCRQKKWSISIFTGYTLLGPAQSLKNRIMESDFRDTSPGYATETGFIDAVKYPKSSISPAWNIELRYRVSKHTTFGFDAGQLSKYRIAAYDHLFTIPNEANDGYPVGNYLTLKSDLKAVSVLYIRKLHLVNDEISIGPALGMSRIVDVDTKGTKRNPGVFKPGIQLGYAIDFVKTKGFYLKAQLKYNWFPDAHVATIAKDYDNGTYAYNPENHTSIFKATKVSVSTIRIGLSAGFRF